MREREVRRITRYPASPIVTAGYLGLSRYGTQVQGDRRYSRHELRSTS